MDDIPMAVYAGHGVRVETCGGLPGCSLSVVLRGVERMSEELLLEGIKVVEVGSWIAALKWRGEMLCESNLPA